MSKLYKNCSLFLLVFLAGTVFSSCSPLSKGSSNDKEKDQKDKVNYANDNGNNNKCQMEFKGLGLCAEAVTNHSPLSVVLPNTFEIRFWQKSDPADSRIYTTNGLTPKVWLRMSCCGSVRNGILKSKPTSEGIAEPGVYLFGPVTLGGPGIWELHIQLYEGSKALDAVVQNFDAK
jgi:hypothetical protein